MACNAWGWNLKPFDLSAGFNYWWSALANSSAICLILRWKGALLIKRSDDFWNFLIYLRAAFPGLDLFFLTSYLAPVVTGADFLDIFWEARFFFIGLRDFPFSVCLALALERGIFGNYISLSINITY